MEWARKRSYWARTSWTTALAIGLVAAIALPTAAQEVGEETSPSPTDDEQRALDLFMEAERIYEEGRVEESLALLVEARALHPEPVLLFNMARAYETLGRLEEALTAYGDYLEEDPAAPDRGAIETRIEAIESQLAERARLEREGEAAAARTREQDGVGPLPFVVMATGIAALGAGLTLGLLADGARDDAIADPVHESATEAFERGEDFALAANVLFIAGGALTAIGLTWLSVELLSNTSADVAATVDLGLGHATLRVALP